MEDRGCRGRPSKLQEVRNGLFPFKIRTCPAAPLELAETSGPGYIQLLYGQVWPEPKPYVWKQGLNYA